MFTKQDISSNFEIFYWVFQYFFFSLNLTSSHTYNHLKLTPRPFEGPLVRRAGRRARARKALASSREPRNKEQWRGPHAELRTSHVRPARLLLMAETHKKKIRKYQPLRMKIFELKHGSAQRCPSCCCTLSARDGFSCGGILIFPGWRE